MKFFCFFFLKKGNKNCPSGYVTGRRCRWLPAPLTATAPLSSVSCVVMGSPLRLEFRSGHGSCVAPSSVSSVQLHCSSVSPR